jgi:heavy metal translocating P-type ATPase
MNWRPRFHLPVVLCCTLALAGGVLLQFWQMPLPAARLWQGSAALVLLFVLGQTLLALWRRQWGLDLIALLTLAGALALQENLTAAVIALMFVTGRALENHAERRAQQEMSALLAKVPQRAHRYENGRLVEVALAQIRPADRLLVRPGETVPVDGTLLGAAVVDQSTLSGESLPLSCAQGAFLPSGSINAGEAFELLASSTAEQGTLGHIVRLVHSAQQSRAPAVRLADRYALWFVPVALGLAALAWLLSGEPERALAVAVVATPCPLILAVPVALVCAMSRCAQRGVLIKHGGALEKLAHLHTLFLDKTGTLTSGKARLTAIDVAPGMEAHDLLRLAASLEQLSAHAIAQAVVAAALARGLTLALPEQVSEQPGAGLTGQVDGRQVRVGTRDFVLGLDALPDWAVHPGARIGYEGTAGVYLALDGHLAGVMQLADQVRLETPRALRLLRTLGAQRIVMLTGDHREVATTIGHALGVDDILSEQTPASKLEAIRQARQQGVTMMVGDGVNDAPALAAADVGVAMGARGAAAAAESAQVVLLVDRLDRLAFAVRLAQQTRRIALQSVVAGMGLSLLAMVVAALGYLPPVAGAVLQELIDVAVILNALRVLTLEREEARAQISAADLLALQQEHAALAPVIDRLLWLAERCDVLPVTQLREHLHAVSELLKTRLLPHESEDDARLYPRLARLIGGRDPLASMSSTHREIHRLSRTIERLAADMNACAASQPPDAATSQEVRHALYALEAILRLHFAQEEEIFHGLSS